VEQNGLSVGSCRTCPMRLRAAFAKNVPARPLSSAQPLYRGPAHHPSRAVVCSPPCARDSAGFRAALAPRFSRVTAFASREGKDVTIRADIHNNNFLPGPSLYKADSMHSPIHRSAVKAGNKMETSCGFIILPQWSFKGRMLLRGYAAYLLFLGPELLAGGSCSFLEKIPYVCPAPVFEAVRGSLEGNCSRKCRQGAVGALERLRVSAWVGPGPLQAGVIGKKGS
jgi:hypothetical protein